MATAAFPSFTAPSPMPPQQHCEGIFYGAVAGIQAAAAPLQAAACHVFAAVRLQAAARGLLTRRRLQEMRRQMHEVALTTVDLGKGGRVHVPSDGHQQSRRFATIFTREQSVVSAVGVGNLQLYGSNGSGGGSLFVVGGDALPSSTAFRYRPPRGRLRWTRSQLIPGGRTRAPLSFRWSPWDPGGDIRTDPARGRCSPYLQESSKIKSHSLFKISRDVKDLFLGVRFASSGVIVSVIVRLQLENELHVQVGCSVRGVKGLLGLSPLGC